MSRDDLYIRWKLRDDLFDGVDHAVNTPATVHIDEGKSVGYEVVPHVHHIRFRKENDRVAVGVAGGKMQRPDVFAVQVYRDIMIKGDDG